MYRGRDNEHFKWLVHRGNYSRPRVFKLLINNHQCVVPLLINTIIIANYFDSMIANSLKAIINRLSCRKNTFQSRHNKTCVQKIKAISTSRFVKEPVAITRVARSLKRKYLTRKLHKCKVTLKLETRVFCMRINGYAMNTLNYYSLLPVN